MDPIQARDWVKVGELMAKSAEQLAKAGAEFALCPDKPNPRSKKGSQLLSCLSDVWNFSVENSPFHRMFLYMELTLPS